MAKIVPKRETRACFGSVPVGPSMHACNFAHHMRIREKIEAVSLPAAPVGGVSGQCCTPVQVCTAKLGSPIGPEAPMARRMGGAMRIPMEIHRIIPEEHEMHAALSKSSLICPHACHRNISDRESKYFPTLSVYGPLNRVRALQRRDDYSGDGVMQTLGSAIVEAMDP